MAKAIRSRACVISEPVWDPHSGERQICHWRGGGGEILGFRGRMIEEMFWTEWKKFVRRPVLFDHSSGIDLPSWENSPLRRLQASDTYGPWETGHLIDLKGDKPPGFEEIQPAAKEG